MQLLDTGTTVFLVHVAACTGGWVVMSIIIYITSSLPVLEMSSLTVTTYVGPCIGVPYKFITFYHLKGFIFLGGGLLEVFGSWGGG